MDQNKNPKRAAVVYSYRGQDSQGYLRLHAAGEELLIAGALYAASSPGKKPPSGPRKVALVMLQASSGFVRDRQRDSTFSVRTETGERFRVIGRIVNAVKLPLETKKHRVLLAAAVVPTPTQSLTAPASELRRKPNKDQQFKRENERVSALAAQGHDPEVRMAFVKMFIGMSASNLHKKVRAGTFPAPIKRGASALWKLSTLRAYQDGSWLSATQP